MTRFKELRRIERAIEHRDQTELRWAADYCRWRQQFCKDNKRGWSRWNKMLKRVEEAIMKHEG
jgi:hypothetical protein